MSNDEKLDLIIAEITEIKVITAKQEVNMREHMRRTALLETAHKEHEQIHDSDIETLKQEIQVLHDRKVMVDGILKFLGLIGLFSGIITGLIKLLAYLR